MPHQCLKCGRIFQEGSAQLLKGCPNCGGNRFFYTKEPLDEKARSIMEEKIGKDINETIMELIGEHGETSVDKSGKWVDIKPKDVRKAMKKHLADRNEKVISDNKEPNELLSDEYRRNSLERVKAEVQQSDSPETIDVERPGSYKIDLKGLLDEEPIIIQKDGSYTIHLPSLFKMADKEKEKR